MIDLYNNLSKNAVALVMTLLLTSSLYAQNGVYMSFGAGLNSHADSDITSSGGSSATFAYDDGHMLNASIGYGFNAYRIELELVSSKNDVESITVGVNSAVASGSLKTYSQFLNVYYQHPLNEAWELFGAVGVGKARMRLEEVTNESAHVTIANGEDKATAYQLKIGSQYRLRDHLELTLTGRYMRSGSTAYEDLASHQPFDVDSNEQFGLEAGLRYTFVME